MRRGVVVAVAVVAVVAVARVVVALAASRAIVASVASPTSRPTTRAASLQAAEDKRQRRPAVAVFAELEYVLTRSAPILLGLTAARRYTSRLRRPLCRDPASTASSVAVWRLSSKTTYVPRSARICTRTRIHSAPFELVNHVVMLGSPLHRHHPDGVLHQPGTPRLQRARAPC